MIEQNVLKIAKGFTPDQRFHINHLRWMILFRFGQNLSYKQVRDALYRVREWTLIEHTGKGWYQWVL